MVPNRRNNYCCGGGGGMLSMSEYGERRVAAGQLNADQIRTTGAKIVATPCHNCAYQLLEISKRCKLGVELKAVVELVYSALVWQRCLSLRPPQAGDEIHAPPRRGGTGARV
jgi:Fe-S oxidoreductase